MSRSSNGEDRLTNIYVLVDPRDEVFNPRYIGITVQSIKRRLQKHVCDSKKYTLHVSNWIKSLISDGIYPKTILIDEVIGWDNACEIEVGLIKLYRSKGYILTNLTNGGEGTVGSPRPHTKERRISASIRCMGSNNPNYGKSMSDENKTKLSLLKVGKKLSPEHILKARMALIGHIHSQETKDKLSIAGFNRIMEIVICPHCGKSGNTMIMHRWHFDNCKFKTL